MPGGMILEGILGGIQAGATTNVQELRMKAEEQRQRSFAALMQQYGRENMEFSSELAGKRDDKNRAAAKEDDFERYVRDRSAKASDYQRERADKQEDFKTETETRKSLIGYEAGVKKANAIIGYSEDGLPLTFAEVKPGMTVYADAVGREKMTPKSVEQAKWEYIQEHGTDQEKKKAAGGLISDTDKGGVKPQQALKEVAAIDMQIGNIKKGQMLTEEGMAGILEQMPELAPFINSKAEMSPEDKEVVIKSLTNYRNYLEQFLPVQNSGIMGKSSTDEVGADIKSLLGK